MYASLTGLYESRCPVCGGYTNMQAATANQKSAGPYDDFLDDIAEKLLKDKAQNGYIHPGLYKQTADDIFKQVTSGLGGKEFGYEDGRNTLKAYLQQNICSFSAAKSLTEYEHIRDLLAESEGDNTKFRNAVTDANYQFNKVWLDTEANTANASAISADNYDNLKASTETVEYSTAGDDKVRPTHAALDGLTFDINSPVLRKLWPPIDWECRCHMRPGIASRIQGDAVTGKLVKQALTNPQFAFNPGIEKLVFKDDHPYFEALGKLKELDAEKNYGLPSVKKLYNDFEFPKIPQQNSVADYKAWWDAQPKVKGTDNIEVVDRLKTSVLFDSADTTGSKKINDFFKDHVLRKASEKRYEYAANFIDILKAADEIWSVRESNVLSMFYIKYYDDAPYVVVVNDDNGTLTAETIYRLTDARATELRRGALLYTKK